MRFAMTARTVARLREEGKEANDMTLRNVEKVTQFRRGGEAAFESMVKKVGNLKVGARNDALNAEKRWGGRV
jgi:large subunit ribosomal protein L17